MRRLLFVLQGRAAACPIDLSNESVRGTTETAASVANSALPARRDTHFVIGTGGGGAPIASPTAGSKRTHHGDKAQQGGVLGGVAGDVDTADAADDATDQWVECNRCNKWRKLPDHVDLNVRCDTPRS